MLNNPDPEKALRGDLTAMMAYTTSVYSHQNPQSSLLQEFKELIRPLKRNQTRKDINEQMLTTDSKKFNFAD